MVDSAKAKKEIKDIPTFEFCWCTCNLNQDPAALCFALCVPRISIRGKGMSIRSRGTSKGWDTSWHQTAWMTGSQPWGVSSNYFRRSLENLCIRERDIGQWPKVHLYESIGVTVAMSQCPRHLLIGRSTKHWDEITEWSTADASSVLQNVFLLWRCIQRDGIKYRVDKSKAQQANDASLGIFSTFSPLSTLSTFRKVH